MGVLTLAQTAPYLLIQLIAGVWVDRVRRRPLLIAADLGRALLLASIPLAALVGRLGLPQLYLVAFFANVLTVLFSVSYQAYLPALVSPEHLSDGNAKLTVSRQVAQLAGPGLAGVAVQALTAPVAILVDAVSFVGSGLCLATLRVPESPPARGGRRLWRDIGEGLHWVAVHPLLRAGAGSAGTYTFFNTMLTTVYLLYLTRDLRLPPATVGVIQMAGGVGAFASAVVATRVTAWIGLATLLIGAAGTLLAVPWVVASPLRTVCAPPATPAAD
jgi:MFS family permease